MRNRIQQQLRIGWLMLVNLLRIRQLRMLDHHMERQFVNDATRTDIYWNVQGCHRIQVEGFGTYSGNVNGISLLEKQEGGQVAITFFGWSNNLTHIFHIPATLEKVLHTFRSETEKWVVPQNIVVANVIKVKTHWQLTNQIDSFTHKPVNLTSNPAISNLSVSFNCPKIHIS